MPLLKRPQNSFLSLLPYEDAARRLLSMYQEAGPHRTPNLPVLILNLPTSRKSEINVCYVSTRYFCYSSPNRLRHLLTFDDLFMVNVITYIHHLSPSPMYYYINIPITISPYISKWDELFKHNHNPI